MALPRSPGTAPWLPEIAFRVGLFLCVLAVAFFGFGFLFFDFWVSPFLGVVTFLAFPKHPARWEFVCFDVFQRYLKHFQA